VDGKQGDSTFITLAMTDVSFNPQMLPKHLRSHRFGEQTREIFSRKRESIINSLGRRENAFRIIEINFVPTV